MPKKQGKILEQANVPIAAGGGINPPEIDELRRNRFQRKNANLTL
jgi:hypothetical protein